MTAPREAAFAEVRVQPAPAGAPPPPPAAFAPPANQAEAFALEHRRVLDRRRFHGNGYARAPHETVGLALSGGGIRSATFSLGVLRALGRLGRLPHIDYLSTVSGGGYIGAFLCSRYVPQEWRGDVEQTPQGTTVGGTGDPFEGAVGEKAFEHLRQSGRNLLPGNSGEVFNLLVQASRNWLAVQIVLGLSFLAIFLLLKPVQVLLARPGAAIDFEARLAEAGLSPRLWPSLWLEGYPVGHWFIASVLLLLAAMLTFVVAALFWSYFLTRGNFRTMQGRLRRFFGPSFFIGATVTAIGASFVWRPNLLGLGMASPRGVGGTLIALALVAIGAYAVAQFRDWLTMPDRASANSPRVQEDRVRAKLTQDAAWVLRLAAILGFLGLIDSLAQTIYLRWGELTASLSLGGMVVAAVPLLRRALIRLPGLSHGAGRTKALLRRFGRQLALLAGLVLLFAIALFWAVLAHWIAWRGGAVASLGAWVPARGETGPGLAPLTALTVTALVFVVIALFIGISFAFLNMSTFARFYATRLRRSYLGASNRDRYRAVPPGGRPVRTDSDQVNDDIALDRYYDPGVRAPLHLINVTINDTASASSNTVQRDRRGKPLTISPAGYLYPPSGTRDPVNVIPFGGHAAGAPERLPLSAWIGISGAAASTGMGQYGSVGMSLLAGLANVRLGHWWDPGGVAATREGWLGVTVQARLADELIGRFPGSDGNRWYLTDGGHFENSAAYELVRRRVATIVLCDSGADPGYAFADLVTLTRRIKIDFDAELTFLDDAGLDAALGTRTALRAAFAPIRALGMTVDDERRIGPYAALGRIRYDRPAADGVHPVASSTLLLLKPRICGSEAADLAAYARANPPFPQQSTIDQLYDEAQWESYFRLGLLVGETVFRPPDAAAAGRWSPHALKPLP